MNSFDEKFLESLIEDNEFDIASEGLFEIPSSAIQYNVCGKFKLRILPFNNGNGKSLGQRGKHHIVSCKIMSKHTNHTEVGILMTDGIRCVYPRPDKKAKHENLKKELEFVNINYENIVKMAYDLTFNDVDLTDDYVLAHLDLVTKRRTRPLPETIYDVINNF